MQIITITSDWNEDDYYVASLKGKILSTCPDIRIVDISHRVKTFNTSHAAFLVRNSYGHFPPGTIHIIAVNSEPEEGGQLLAARMDGQYFLCADNGLLGLLGGPEPELVIRIGTDARSDAHSFVALSIFTRVACQLAEGVDLASLGDETDIYNKQIPLRPTIEDSTLTGSVIHIDSYQNAITNISREFFDRVGQGRPFRIYVQSKRYVVEKINKGYMESGEGDLLALFNAVGLLEIAIRNGNAAGLLNLTTSSTIRVVFNQEEDA